MPSNPPPKLLKDSPERREFFRIEDHIGLEVRKLSPGTPVSEATFGNNHLESLKTDFKRLDQDVRSQLASLSERDRFLTGLIKSMNGKLDTLARIMAFEQNPLQPEDWQNVTLSEGGLAFSTAASVWKPGDRLAVRMTLPPELFQPQAAAEVIEICPDTTGTERVHIQFTDIQDSDRQQIVRHVMRWQIRQRQSQ
ncbi:MAG TPA: PilZ domain-containing protein [Marinobacter sp.]|nr:PilZ domain-containing protein [Marinobacter sp.]